MNSENLKIQIGNNIAAYRKHSAMTQAELAERLNYSDKAVSKWERGESVPDVITLVALAELFGITVNDLLAETAVEDIPEPEQAAPKKRVNKLVIQMLVSLLVWFVALLVYVILDSVHVPRSWVGFIYAIPVNAIVLLSLRSAWRMYSWNHALVSVIVWGCLLALYSSMLIFTRYNIWKVFLLGLIGQAAVTLWFFIFRHPKEKKNG